MADWNPDDPALRSQRAPHELSGVMRWHRAKVPSQEIMRLLRLKGTQLIKQIEDATVSERQAIEKNLPVHAELMPEEEK